MESLITAAARALAAGDPLGALNRVALRNDAPSLALRGIAMAQLGDLAKAKSLLRSAARAFGPREAVARARCVVAEAEIALVSRDLNWPEKTLAAARATLERHGDLANATHAGHIEARRLLLLGRPDEAGRTLADLGPLPLPPASQVVRELVIAGIAIRQLRTKDARAALGRAARAARLAGIAALTAEVESTSLVLDIPAARLITRGEERPLLLEQIEDLATSAALVVDTFHHSIRRQGTIVPLGTRPVLFALARILAQAWPADVSREALITGAFQARYLDESHRARLRVEIGRLRAKLRPIADVTATKQGFALTPRKTRQVLVLARPVEEKHATILALLSDGEPWSSSALALALGTSARTVQRSLDELARTNKVQSFGHGRARRWMTPPIPGFPTTLLLPGPLLKT
ncbi:helix-turn-helix domain-containing protein [Bradyrhizobium sp. 141]|uniref:helix-turn-helix domain-containing protein n=1 Tax=Bradyrhizobium sp. 141 TaxID=2782617 RepID=UPI001FFB4640|nr:helix-turn-helix domain-containing protein [Bradyrhizobium sp. 141]MCK1720999.1 helix-turn-helix domain-containing protein [Bradyrhizobium sp. 141]